MNPATQNSTQLEIDGMTGEKCVGEVRAALKAVPNVTTQSVGVGTATIAADPAGCAAACGALGAAGYKARESKGRSAPNAPNAASTGGSPEAQRGGSGESKAPDASRQPRQGKSDDAQRRT